MSKLSSLRKIACRHFADVIYALDDRLADSLLDDIVQAIIDAPMILTGGNGGSAALAIHFAADLRSIGFNAWDMLSPSKITQIGNDVGELHVFSEQVKACPEALVILFSGSGTSGNIAQVYRDTGNKTILFTSTMKGLLPYNAWTVFKVDSADYEVIEDVHSAVCHALKKELRAYRERECCAEGVPL